jgi:hypothetical protein
MVRLVSQSQGTMKAQDPRQECEGMSLSQLAVECFHREPAPGAPSFVHSAPGEGSMVEECSTRFVPDL